LKICKFALFGIEASYLLKWLQLITGWDICFEDFLKTGERIFNLKRLYNVRSGISKFHDTLPERILTLKRKKLFAPEKLPDLDKMLREYYSIRGWTSDGIPRKEKIRELDLSSYLAISSI
jgi:aldehyde:ferredoxin oxidoreductase